MENPIYCSFFGKDKMFQCDTMKSIVSLKPVKQDKVNNDQNQRLIIFEEIETHL